MEDWQKQRLDFYQNSGALEFIKNYFDVKKGVRCIVPHIRDMYKLRHDPTYRLWKNTKCKSFTLPDMMSKDGFVYENEEIRDYSSLISYQTIHSYIYTYDKSILEWHEANESKSMFKKNKVGLNGLIELDAPDDPTSTKARRLSFFDCIYEFDKVIKIITDYLDNITTDYNIQLSGNGIYIIIEGYYESDLLEEDCFNQQFTNLIDTLKKQYDLNDKYKVHICNGKPKWSSYFKIPFTFHETRPRISIPLPKGKLDKDWIDYHSNVNNLMNNYSLIDEIIKKSGWNKIW